MMSLEELASRSCVPCKGTQPLTFELANSIIATIPGWKLLGGAIEKEFRFKSYLAGLEFANTIGRVAEQQDHHPDILVRWRRVEVVFTTHAIEGLSMNDFIMAAKSELLFKQQVSHSKE